MEQDKLSSRRNYSAQFRALVLEQCAAPGTSVAKVALLHGMNANVVHRWRREARDSAASVSAREFVPVSVSTPPVLAQDCADIRIELRRGATTMAITWPSAAAGQCAAWMRELLR
jgi:transposase